MISTVPSPKKDNDTPNTIEAVNKIAQADIGKLKEFTDGQIDIVTKIGKDKKTAAGVAGYGVGFLATAILLTGTPNNFSTFVECIFGGFAGGGVTSYIVQEIDERRKRIQIEKIIERDFQIIRDYPELRPLLEQKLNYDFQTESILLRGDSIGAVQALPWGNNSPSNPQQNTLPPATNPQNTLPPATDTENPT
jgi:hypothetical protein